MSIPFDKETFTLATAITGVAFGLLGAVLGILNTWRAFDRDRVRVRVIPRMYAGDELGVGICIEVVNLSYIPVTITQVGFADGGSGRIIHTNPITLNGARLPQRLEARTAFTTYWPAGAEKDRQFSKVRTAFAETACGRQFTGRSGALRSCIKAARASQQ